MPFFPRDTTCSLVSAVQPKITLAMSFKTCLAYLEHTSGERNSVPRNAVFEKLSMRKHVNSARIAAPSCTSSQVSYAEFNVKSLEATKHVVEKVVIILVINEVVHGSKVDTQLLNTSTLLAKILQI